jgi:hypothetical protein
MEAEGGEFKSKSVNNSNNSVDERNEIMEVEEVILLTIILAY